MNKIEPPAPVDEDLYELAHGTRRPKIQSTPRLAWPRCWTPSKPTTTSCSSGGVFTQDLIDEWIELQARARGRRDRPAAASVRVPPLLRHLSRQALLPGRRPVDGLGARPPWVVLRHRPTTCGALCEGVTCSRNREMMLAPRDRPGYANGSRPAAHATPRRINSRYTGESQGPRRSGSSAPSDWPFRTFGWRDQGLDRARRPGRRGGGTSAAAHDLRTPGRALRRPSAFRGGPRPRASAG